MKFQKIDQKQLPQVVVLGVLSAGVLGWAAMQWLGSSRPANAAPQKDDQQLASAAAPGAEANGGVTAGMLPSDTDPAPKLAVPGGYNPDPFRGPAPKVEQPSRSEPPPPPPDIRVERSFGPLPNPGGLGPGRLAPVEQQPVEEPPVRPTLAVTGIIDVEGGTDMALVELGQSQRIVQVGDMVDTYKVKKIDLKGLLLVNGKDRFFAALASTEKDAGKGG